MQKVLLIFIGTLALSACTLQPRYTRPTAPITDQYPQAYTANETLTAFSAADIGWRDFFTDPHLHHLIELALKNNRDLRIAILNVEYAQAQYKIQRAGLAPTLQTKGNVARGHIPESISPIGREITASQYHASVGADWEIDLFGKIRSLKDVALAQYLATAQVRKATEIMLIAQVATQYYTTRALETQLTVTQATVKAMKSAYELTQLRLDSGVGHALDTFEAQSSFEQTQAHYHNQLRLYAQANHTLTLLVGQPLLDALPPTKSFKEHTLSNIPAGLPSELLTRRPDIMAAEYALKAANANIGAARAAFFPSISLTGQWGSASNALNGLFKSGSLEWNFASQISLPLSLLGRNLSNLRASHTQKAIAIAQYEKTIQTAFREVADALAARQSHMAQITALENTERAQQQRVDLATLRYKNGIDGYLRVLAAQTDLYTVQQQHISSRLANLTNLIELYRTLGGGWIERTGETPRSADTKN